MKNPRPAAPTGTNVDFVEVVGPDRVRVRTFEKGVEAETLACGTGALASALVAHLDGRLGEGRERSVAVEMPGGTLTVGFRAEGEAVAGLTLAGPAETVYEGRNKRQSFLLRREDGRWRVVRSDFEAVSDWETDFGKPIQEAG